MDKKVVLFLFILLILPMVLGVPYYKSGEVLELKVPCFLDGAYCSDSANCNITIIDSDGNVLVDDVNMTNSGAYFNYSFDNSDGDVGIYTQQVVCVDGGEAGYSINDFKVTPSGVEGSTGDAVVYTVLLFVFLILMIACFFGGAVIDGENKYDFGAKLLEINYGKYLKMGLFACGTLFLWFLSFCGWQVSEMFLMFNFFSNTMYVIFIVLTVLMPLVFMVLVILTLFKWLADNELLRSHLRNVPVRRKD